MNAFLVSIVLAMLANAVIGLLVFLSNPRRAANRAFALLSLFIGVWTLCLFNGTRATTVEELELWVRMATAVGPGIPFGFDVLRMAIVGRFRHAPRRARLRCLVWLVVMTVLAALCQTPSFIRSVDFPGPGQTVAVPVYGPAYQPYAFFSLVATAIVLVSIVRDILRTTGIPRMELQFVLLGTLSVLPVGVAFLVISILLRNPEIGRFLPVTIVLLDGFIAYGVATRRILGVPHLLQRMAAYTFQLVFLMAMYALCDAAALFALRFFAVRYAEALAHAVGTTVMLVSMMPARGWANALSRRLFLSGQAASFEETIEQAQRMLQTVTRVDVLLARFAEVVQRALQTGPVRVLLREQGGRQFTQRHPAPAGEAAGLDANDSLLLQVGSSRQALVPEALRRRALSDLERQACERMNDLGVALALGVRGAGGLEALVLLDPRPSGRLYVESEQRALRLIAGQLETALENARLYTELQESKLYSELIVDSLLYGLIVTDMRGRVTVMNRKAQELCGAAAAASAPDMPLAALPAPVREVLEETLRTEVVRRDLDRELESRAGNGGVPVRLSSAVFRGHGGASRGVLLLIQDLTDLKKLEEQVRRNDRLSSIGTLSAGMAHEIRNPLVSIKAFAQLLPERYQDPEFRETFFSLIGDEVSRIESIVSRLLGFARRSEPTLNRQGLHTIVQNSVRLVEQQARTARVKVELRLQCPGDAIHGSPELLRQALVNLLLNAIQAMPDGGVLTVATAAGATGGVNLSIADTGCGIRPEDLPRIFDPFFTTKPAGTGMGLSVAHGIFQEHHAAVDVESTPGAGTVFTVFFPAVGQEGDEEA